MVLESAQMLSTAINVNGGYAPYKTTHVNHPANVWCRQSKSNYLWLLDHFVALGQEYTRRYGKVHKSMQYLEDFKRGAEFIPDGKLTEFANCARNKSLGVDYTNIIDVPTAYKLYLMDRWETDKNEPKWT